MHNLYKSALALRVLFYFLRSLYIYSSPYLTRDTHYRLIKYITFRVLLCVTHSDRLAVLTRRTLTGLETIRALILVKDFLCRKRIS